MAVLGIVMLLKPVVPLLPVTVIDTTVELSDWFAVILTLDIWELVMLPLIARLTVTPLSVLAFTVVSNGVGEGDGFAVGVEVAVGVLVEMGVCVGNGVGVGDDVEVGENVTVNELLIPGVVESVAVMVTPEPSLVSVTVVDPIPLTKASIVLGLIDPVETVKDGLPM